MDKRDGRGRYTYANGDSYDGEWLKNNKHGNAIYLFAKTKAKVVSLFITSCFSCGYIIVE
jgi:hypothetical protein